MEEVPPGHCLTTFSTDLVDLGVDLSIRSTFMRWMKPDTEGPAHGADRFGNVER